MKFFLFLGIFSSFILLGQNNSSYSPNKYFESVYDRFGKEYNLKELEINKNVEINKLSSATSSSLITCSQAGYFDLYFEAGSGMELNNSIHNSRRDVLCELFNHISNFIIPQNSSNKVKIWVRNINQISTNPNVLGLATSFYPIPSGTINGGITDNLIFRTISSGVDGYTNFVNPLSIYGGSTAGFYHGMIAFNFNQNWHTNPLTNASSQNFDLYSVALHEITHALGFASLIDLTGNSQINQSNWYSRYDSFLKSQFNVPLITNNTNCSLYDFIFNPTLNTSIFYPNCSTANHIGSNTDHSNCLSTIQYSGSVTIPVYTPDCFEYGSSLSHFEDECYVPATFTPQPPLSNNLYYVMSNANGSGTTKRHLSPEERLVFCDLGYKVSNTYGNISTFGSEITYTQPPCVNNYIAGVNDGITGGLYNYLGNINANINIPVSGINGILSNDINADSFECLKDIYSPVGMSSLNITSGTTSSNIIFSSLQSGVKVLQYIPYNSQTGIRGNITYIYVYIESSNCNVSSCDIVNNGSFENAIGCGFSGLNISCWSNFSGTSDLLTTTCSALSGYGGYQIGVNTLSSVPAAITWDNSPSNTKFAGIWSSANQPGYGSQAEAFQSTLSSSLISGQSYDITFHAVISNNTNTYSGIQNLISNTITPAPVEIWAIPNILPGVGIFNDPLIQLPVGSTKLGNTMLVPKANPNGMNWHLIQQSFTYNGPNTNNAIVIFVNPVVFANITSSLSPPVSGLSTYVYFDDLSIKPSASTPVFSIPNNTFCINSPSLSNLQAYASPPGGTFSGDGISFSNNQYSFNPSGLAVGIYTINYSSSNNGCLSNTSQTVQVVNSSSVNINSTATSICPGQTATITATGGNTYTWQPGASLSNSIIVTPTITTTYTLYSDNACGILTNTFTINVTQNPPLIISTSQNTICPGTSLTLNCSGGANSYTWQPGNIISNTLTVSPTSTTTYSVNSNTGCGLLSQTITIFTFNYPALIATASHSIICPNTTTTLSAIGGSNSYTWQPGNIISNTITVNPLTTSIYTVTSITNCEEFEETITIITFSNNPLSIISSQATICSGDTATLTATGGTSTYSWQPINASNNPIIVSPINTTTYTVFSNELCGIITSSIIVFVSDSSSLVINASNYTLCPVGQSSTLTATALGTFTWQPGNFFGNIYVVYPNVTTTYTVTNLYCNNLKQDSLTIIIEEDCNILEEPYIPNVFTPNGDGYNDVWRIKLPLNTIMKEIKIYNRWGLLIFESNNANIGWDGRTTSGEICADATYFYVFNYMDNKNNLVKKHGFISLLK
jgi:gliding motility-associated-like protein